jgi:hypothetical protein
MFCGGKYSLFLIATAFLWAQQPTVPQPSSSGAPALVYQHKPLRLPLACRAGDFEAAAIECTEEEPCRVFLELTAVDATGPKIVLVGNLHTSFATLASLALTSEDAGSTWHEPLKRMPATGFESVQLLNERQGWIAAQPEGQIAADPFLLATSDGGANWQRLPIWSEEGRSGILQQFNFDSGQHGFALIDRSQSGTADAGYELYESPNGGLTWMLREVSPKPITPKWTARRTTDWRLREDSRAKTYELERRVGDGWQRMANFLTDLGGCKALEPVTPPAPAPPPQPGPPGTP